MRNAHVQPYLNTKAKHVIRSHGSRYSSSISTQVFFQCCVKKLRDFIYHNYSNKTFDIEYIKVGDELLEFEYFSLTKCLYDKCHVKVLIFSALP